MEPSAKTANAIWAAAAASPRASSPAPPASSGCRASLADLSNGATLSLVRTTKGPSRGCAVGEMVCSTRAFLHSMLSGLADAAPDLLAVGLAEALAGSDAVPVPDALAGGRDLSPPGLCRSFALGGGGARHLSATLAPWNEARSSADAGLAIAVDNPTTYNMSPGMSLHKLPSISLAFAGLKNRGSIDAVWLCLPPPPGMPTRRSAAASAFPLSSPDALARSHAARPLICLVRPSRCTCESGLKLPLTRWKAEARKCDKISRTWLHDLALAAKSRIAATRPKSQQHPKKSKAASAKAPTKSGTPLREAAAAGAWSMANTVARQTGRTAAAAATDALGMMSQTMRCQAASSSAARGAECRGVAHFHKAAISLSKVQLSTPTPSAVRMWWEVATETMALVQDGVSPEASSICSRRGISTRERVSARLLRRALLSFESLSRAWTAPRIRDPALPQLSHFCGPSSRARDASTWSNHAETGPPCSSCTMG
mmetsp:Transcript_5499/g.23280  ORF Transcript_5499/g.23280 Transcript_5499/m.23280 type:complete len:485 (-) Transcript_5499:1323-2777(-)